MTAEIKYEDFCRRFKKHMLSAYPHERFSGGELVADYADEAAESHWRSVWRNDTPEVLADAEVAAWEIN